MSKSTLDLLLKVSYIYVEKVIERLAMKPEASSKLMNLIKEGKQLSILKENQLENDHAGVIESLDMAREYLVEIVDTIEQKVIKKHQPVKDLNKLKRLTATLDKMLSEIDRTIRK